WRVANPQPQDRVTTAPPTTSFTVDHRTALPQLLHPPPSLWSTGQLYHSSTNHLHHCGPQDSFTTAPPPHLHHCGPQDSFTTAPPPTSTTVVHRSALPQLLHPPPPLWSTGQLYHSSSTHLHHCGPQDRFTTAPAPTSTTVDHRTALPQLLHPPPPLWTTGPLYPIRTYAARQTCQGPWQPFLCCQRAVCKI
ncbi:extensin-1-like, partial [Hyalella azteca]|uniref:Extensin-1-like n=1 Tax=Hyalella azteca TaxID=294128 RepID=A0A8B7N634_HYAAZ